MSLPRFGEPEANVELEAFLGECLHGAGVWRSRRESDDIDYVRPVESTPGRLRLIGRIWILKTQAREPFWLDLTREAEGRVRWT
ncbi:MAG TPA: hypothetical protein VFF12_01095, partial [Myxococcaceae bacterium]|nr:hypothetical protein [Myxococcaceae bacterium]